MAINTALVARLQTFKTGGTRCGLHVGTAALRYSGNVVELDLQQGLLEFLVEAGDASGLGGQRLYVPFDSIAAIDKTG